MIVSTHPAIWAAQKLGPLSDRPGLSRSSGRDGKTNQRSPRTWWARFTASGRSRQSRTIPRTEISGGDAMSASEPA